MLPELAAASGAAELSSDVALSPQAVKINVLEASVRRIKFFMIWLLVESAVKLLLSILKFQLSSFSKCVGALQ
jgi:hypothetical protein